MIRENGFQRSCEWGSYHYKRNDWDKGEVAASVSTLGRESTKTLGRLLDKALLGMARAPNILLPSHAQNAIESAEASLCVQHCVHRLGKILDLNDEWCSELFTECFALLYM
jgi:hypothetical protein